MPCMRAHRKQCIELEQQFDFLKDLVAAVPDMQGEGEENHTEAVGEKVSRRYVCLYENECLHKTLMLFYANPQQTNKTGLANS